MVFPHTSSCLYLFQVIFRSVTERVHVYFTLDQLNLCKVLGVVTFRKVVKNSITFCLNPLLMIRDGHITPVEVRVNTEQRSIFEGNESNVQKLKLCLLFLLVFIYLFICLFIYFYPTYNKHAIKEILTVIKLKEGLSFNPFVVFVCSSFQVF